MLAEIGPMLGGGPGQDAPAPSAWWQYAVADDVVVWAKADVSPWRIKQIRAAIGEMTTRLSKGEANE
jgi:hypothetical protein